MIDKVVLWWSGGLESTLLLAMMRESGESFDILQIREGWTREQKTRADDLIKRWNLKVFAYSPRHSYFIGQGDEIALVQEMPVGTGMIPILRDVVEGTQCIADLPKERMQYSPFHWDVNIVGSRKGDHHWALGSPIPAKEWSIGEAKFIAPLYEWTREKVIEKSLEYGLNVTPVSDTADTGNVIVCSKCLRGNTYCPKENKFIPAVEWDKERNLEHFRKTLLPRMAA